MKDLWPPLQSFVHTFFVCIFISLPILFTQIKNISRHYNFSEKNFILYEDILFISYFKIHIYRYEICINMWVNIILTIESQYSIYFVLVLKKNFNLFFITEDNTKLKIKIRYKKVKKSSKKSTERKYLVE